MTPPEEVLREALGSARLAHRGLWRAVSDREPSGIIQGYEEKFRSDHERALAALDQLLQERDDTARDAALAVARISAVTIRRLRAERDEARKSVDELQDELVLLSESNARLRADLAEARDIAWEPVGPKWTDAQKQIERLRAALSHQGEPTERKCENCGVALSALYHVPEAPGRCYLSTSPAGHTGEPAEGGDRDDTTDPA